MCHVIEAQLRITSVRGNTEKERAGRNGKSSFREKRKLKHSENKKKTKTKKTTYRFRRTAVHGGPEGSVPILGPPPGTLRPETMR